MGRWDVWCRKVVKGGWMGRRRVGMRVWRVVKGGWVGGWVTGGGGDGGGMWGVEG